MKIDKIEGIGPVSVEKLKKAGIKTTHTLLEKGSSKKGRDEISEKSEISKDKILDWVNMADLFRIKGVAGQFAELLKASGVDTVKELKHRNPENLHKKLTEVNADKNLTRVVPGVSKITEFISEAKTLEAKVKY